MENNQQPQTPQPVDMVEITRQEFDFYQKILLPDFANLIRSLERMGETLLPIVPTSAESAKSGKINQLSQVSLIMQLIPKIQKLMPSLEEELEKHIRPTCGKYHTFVKKYQEDGKHHA